MATAYQFLWWHINSKKPIEGEQCAGKVGDVVAMWRDRRGQSAGIGVVPDSFTHGTSAHGVKWFRKGFESGDLAVCDTFN